MNKSRLTEHQMICFLSQAEACMLIKELSLDQRQYLAGGLTRKQRLTMAA